MSQPLLEVPGMQVQQRSLLHKQLRVRVVWHGLLAPRPLLLGGARLAKSLGVLLVTAANTVRGKQRAPTMPEHRELDALHL